MLHIYFLFFFKQLSLPFLLPVVCLSLSCFSLLLYFIGNKKAFFPNGLIFNNLCISKSYKPMNLFVKIRSQFVKYEVQISSLSVQKLVAQ